MRLLVLNMHGGSFKKFDCIIKYCEMNVIDIVCISEINIKYTLCINKYNKYNNYQIIFDKFGKSGIIYKSNLNIVSYNIFELTNNYRNCIYNKCFKIELDNLKTLLLCSVYVSPDYDGEFNVFIKKINDIQRVNNYDFVLIGGD